MNTSPPFSSRLSANNTPLTAIDSFRKRERITEKKIGRRKWDHSMISNQVDITRIKAMSN